MCKRKMEYIEEEYFNTSAGSNRTTEIIQAKKPWVTTEMLQKMEGKKVKHMSTTEAKKEYRKVSNEFRREIENAKARW